MQDRSVVAMVKTVNKAIERANAMGIRMKAKKNYRLGIRAAFRAYWQGEVDFFGFFSMMNTTIDRGFRQAWAEGAAKCGIAFDELSRDELNALRSQINQETQYIDGVAVFIEQNSKENDGKLRVVMARANLWIEAYDRVGAIAQQMACGDRKLRWTLNPAEHCSSCLRLEGKVKRASFWREKGVYPKAWNKLQCRQGCKCELKETDEPLSRGPLPNLP